MDEAAAYATLAHGYLEQVSAEGASEESREALAAVRDHLEAAVDALPEP